MTGKHDSDGWMADALANEVGSLGPMEMQMQASTVLQLVALLQLAQRHPSVEKFTTAAATGKQFIEAARGYFARCPTVLEVIEAGDDPAQDKLVTLN